jgi:membrane protein
MTSASTTDTDTGGQAEPTQLDKLRARYPWLDHLVRTATRYTEKHGDHYAAAITFFSILALVPLLMVAFAAAAFVLANNQAMLTEIQNAITAAVPPGLGELLNSVIDQAIAQRNAVGIIGLLGALFSGLGWMSNLREALSEQWDQRGEPPSIVKRYGSDLLAMLGLGLAFGLSFAITGVGTGLSSTILEFLGLGDETWAQFLFFLAGLVVTLAANWLVFLWVIARLPRQHTPIRSAVKAAVLGAVGFEILKQVMTVYLSSVTSSPSGAVFGSLLGLLVFVNFVSRFILFVTAWAATAPGVEKEAPAPIPAPAVIRPEVVVRSGPNNATAVGLLGMGAVTALLGLRAFGRRR